YVSIPELGRVLLPAHGRRNDPRHVLLRLRHRGKDGDDQGFPRLAWLWHSAQHSGDGTGAIGVQLRLSHRLNQHRSEASAELLHGRGAITITQPPPAAHSAHPFAV